MLPILQLNSTEHVANYFQHIVPLHTLTSPRPIWPPPNSCVSNNNTNLKAEVQLNSYMR